MSTARKISTAKHGFTIVELIVVVVVIGILVAIMVVGYGSWRHSSITAKVKSDLNSVASAMESYRTFNNAYPVSVPTTYTPTSGVTVTGGSTDGGKTYCTDGTDSSDSSVLYYITSFTKGSGPLPGTCNTYNSMVGWWSFNGGATDATASGANGTVLGPILTTGANGSASGAYAFAGGQYITTPAVHSPTAGAISGWFQSNGTQPASVGSWHIISIPQLADNSRIYIRTNATGDAILALMGTGTTIGTGSISTSAWNNFVLTWSGNSAKFYINGVDKTTTGTFNGLTSAGSTMYIGCISSNALECISGNIDDVRVYNRLLTPLEVQNIYTAGAQW